MDIISQPLGFRGSIPLYYPKSDADYTSDPYEQYHQVVLRNVRNYFLTDFGKQTIDFLQACMISKSQEGSRVIVELGCGIAYHLAALCDAFIEDQFYGFDSSYQMLRMGHELYKEAASSQSVSVPAALEGFAAFRLDQRQFDHMHLALSKADILPLADACCDIVYSCFLWDRMPDLEAFVQEQGRILKRGGSMIIVTPLNYRNRLHWENWYPSSRIIEKITAYGFELVRSDTWQETERIDHHGNALHWQVTGMHWIKKDI